MNRDPHPDRTIAVDFDCSVSNNPIDSVILISIETVKEQEPGEIV